MPWGGFRLCLWDGTVRLNVAVLMMILQMPLLGLGIGSLLVVWCIFYRFDEFSKSGLEFVYWPMVWLVFSVGVIYVVCLSITDWKIFFKNQLIVQTVVFVIIFLIIFFIVLILVAGSLLVDYKKQIRTDSLVSFKSFMELYVREESAKSVMDKIQFEYRCCGAGSYKDWYSVRWVSGEFLDQSLDGGANSHSSSSSRAGTSLPFSCCSLKNMNPCAFVRIPGNPLENETVASTANGKGCHVRLTETAVYWMELLSGLYFGSIALELLDLMVLRYLQTSTDLALMYGDPDQTAPGYLCLCGSRAIPPGVSLDPEELARRQEELQRRAYEDDSELLMADVKISAKDLKRLKMLELAAERRR